MEMHDGNKVSGLGSFHGFLGWISVVPSLSVRALFFSKIEAELFG